MRCPECQSRMLKVGVSFTGAVSCQFGDGNKFRLLEKVSLNSDFPDEAECHCLTCQWDGQVRDIRIDPAQAKVRSSLSGKSPTGSLMSQRELERIADEARKFDAEPKKVSERLIQEVRRLHALLESVTRISESGDAGDTRIG